MGAFHALGKNQFLIQEGKQLTEVDATGKPVAGPFDGLAIASGLRVFRGWKAVRKEDVSGAKWRQVPPRDGAP